MMVLPIAWNEQGEPTMYGATVHSNGRFIGRFIGPSMYLVIANALLRIEIMQLCNKVRVK